MANSVSRADDKRILTLTQQVALLIENVQIPEILPQSIVYSLPFHVVLPDYNFPVSGKVVAGVLGMG